MGTQSRGLIIPFIAAAAIGAHRLVTFAAGAGKVEQANADSDFALGLSTAVPSAVDETTDVQLDGTGRVTAGAAFPQGAQLTADAQGRAIVAGASDTIFGSAMEAAAAVGDIVVMHVHRGQKLP